MWWKDTREKERIKEEEGLDEKVLRIVMARNRATEGSRKIVKKGLLEKECWRWLG